MGRRRWKPSIADQLEDVANSLLDAAYTICSIAEQLRENSSHGVERDSAFLKERQAGARRASKRRKKVAGGLGWIVSALASAPQCLI
jgi:hypothetical protein